MGIHERIQRLESIRLRATRGICYIGIGVTVFFFTMGFFRSTLGMIIGICISGEKAIVALYETKDAFDSRNWLGEISYPDEIRAVQQDIDDIKVIIEMVNRMEHEKNLYLQS